MVDMMKSFKARINKTRKCWFWRGGRYSNGYGEAKLNGKQITAHRLSFILHHGEIPEDACVLHKCDMRSCVNPEHLYLGDRKQNSKDMVSRKRSLKGEKQPMAKLTQDNIAEIKILRALGYKLVDIAKKYKVCHSTISLILSGKRWA